MTVVVPTRNSQETIEACLSSVAAQSYPRIELIVVDNRSTDRTCEIAARYADEILLAGPERSAQRNYGAERASGDYLLFPDSDMVMTEDVVADCVDRIRTSERAVAVVIPEESFGTGFWSDCRRLERLFYKGVDWLEAARFFDRQAFLDMGGYDPRNTGTEDFDLPQRLKARHGEGSIARADALIYHDEQRRTLAEACRMNYYYGHCLDAYRSVEANRDNFRKQQSIFKRYELFFSDPGMLFSNPALGAGVLFMKLAEFSAWATGFLTARAREVLSGKARRRAAEETGKTRVLALLWHSSYDVITAGGFKRTFEILARTPDDFEILAIDNSPTFLADLGNENVAVIEYHFPWFFPWLEQKYFLLERLLEWMLTPAFMLCVSLRLLARGEQFDVVLVPSSEILPSLLAGAILRYLFSARLVMANMNIELFGPLVRRCMAMLHNRSHLVITISDDLTSKLRSSGVKAPIIVTGVGLDTRYIHGVLDGCDFSKEFDAVFVGRHIMLKGIIDLLEAWNLVTKRYPGARLVTIGSCDPEHRAKIDAKIAQYGLEDNVTVMGTVAEHEKFELIAHSKICLFPSYVEGWGIVPLEGLASGLPVIVYDLPVYAENAAPCDAVFAVPPGDWKAMADKAIELLENDSYASYAGPARDFCGGPDWEVVAAGDFKGIKEVLDT